MKKNIPLIILCFLSLASYAQADKYVILISIDGFRPEFYQQEKLASPVLNKWQQMV